MVKRIELKNLGKGIYKRKLQTDQIYIEDTGIVIKGPSATLILFDEVNTPASLLRHVHNQSTKEWMTRDILNRFIELACRENNMIIGKFV